MASRSTRMMEAVFSGQQGAKVAGALLGGGVLPVLAALFAFPNREYVAGVWTSFLGICSAAVGWRGWRANRRAQRRRDAVASSEERLLTPAQHRAKQRRRTLQRKGRRAALGRRR